MRASQHGRRSSMVAIGGLACMAALAARTAMFGASFVAASLQAPRRHIGLHAEEGNAGAAMSYGHCLQEDGSWKMTTEGVPIQGPEDEEMAEKGWKAFSTQFEAAAKRGMYLDTPVAEEDIKYRWRRIRDTFGVSSQEAVSIMEADATPLVIDSNYVQETFEAMVEGSSKEKALEVVKKHPGILASGKAIKDNMAQADVMSSIIGFTRQMFR